METAPVKGEIHMDLYLNNFLVLFSTNEDDLVKIIKIDSVIPEYAISGNPVCSLATVIDRNSILDCVPLLFNELIKSTTVHIYYTVCATDDELYKSINRKLQSSIPSLII